MFRSLFFRSFHFNAWHFAIEGSDGSGIDPYTVNLFASYLPTRRSASSYTPTQRHEADYAPYRRLRGDA